MGCRVTVVPLAVSSGDPGVKAGCSALSTASRPRSAVVVQRTVAELIGRLPLLGICLVTSLLPWCWGKIFKMKFGHRGANHPVKDLLRNRFILLPRTTVLPWTKTRFPGA